MIITYNKKLKRQNEDRECKEKGYYVFKIYQSSNISAYVWQLLSQRQKNGWNEIYNNLMIKVEKKQIEIPKSLNDEVNFYHDDVRE